MSSAKQRPFCLSLNVLRLLIYKMDIIVEYSFKAKMFQKAENTPNISSKY